MYFDKALEALKEGKKIKLASWSGFWQLETERIMMHCKDGRIIDLQDTEDIIYTLSNIASDEWEILDDNYRIIAESEDK